MSLTSPFYFKTLLLKGSYVNFDLPTSYAQQSDFYNTIPPMDSIDVQDFTKTMKIFENDDYMLYSNGIFVNKNTDIMVCPNTVFVDWYSRLLLGYDQESFYSISLYDNISKWMIKVVDENTYQLYKNFILVDKKLIHKSGSGQVIPRTIINYVKPIAVKIDLETHEVLDVVEAYPHELLRLINGRDFSTDYVDLFLGAIGKNGEWKPNLALYPLYSLYFGDMKYLGQPMLDCWLEPDSNRMKVLSWHDVDGTQALDYQTNIAIQYLYNYVFEDFTNLTTALDRYIEDTFGVSTNSLSWLFPIVKMDNARLLSYKDYETCFVKKSDIPYTWQTINPRWIMNFERIGEVVTISYYSNNLTTHEVNMVDVSNYLHSIIPDAPPDQFDSIFNEELTLDYIREQKPISLLVPDEVFPNDELELMKLTVLASYLRKALEPILNSTDYTSDGTVYNFQQYLSFQTLVALNTVPFHYTNSNQTTEWRDTSAITYISEIWKELGFIDIQSNVFHPIFVKDIKQMEDIMSQWGTAKKLDDIKDYELLNQAQSKMVVDSTESFFSIHEDTGFVSRIQDNSQLPNIRWNNKIPQYLFVLRNELGSRDLQIIADKTNFQIVPSHADHPNAFYVNYDGLLFLKTASDGDILELSKIIIHRDDTRNQWKLEFNLHQMDNQMSRRLIRFDFHGGKSKTIPIDLIYEYGLGFELITSENLTDADILKLIYIVIDKAVDEKNLYFDKLLKNLDQLKLHFKKLTSENIELRVVVGNRDIEEIVSTRDMTV